MAKKLGTLVKSWQEGQTVVEYALVVGFIGLASALALGGLSLGWVTTITTSITTAFGEVV